MKLKLRLQLLCILTALMLQSPCYAGGESDFLVFVSADNLNRQSVSQSDIPTSDFTPTVDLLFSHANGPLRILGEYFMTDDERDLERFQVGYDFSADSTIWVGRFHQPSSAWNHHFHHGAYLQPSISRPAIENWEDDDGVVVMHITGLMLDAWHSLGSGGGIRTLVATGVAPKLMDGELVPFDLLDPDSGSQELATNLNLSYYPDIVGESNIGIVASYGKLLSTPMPGLGANSSFVIQQSMFGAQSNWEWPDWKLIAAAYYVDNKVEQTAADAGGWFLSGYLQVARTLSANTNAYLRLEKTHNADNAKYLQIFPEFVSHRELMGFRYDFANRQAVAIEVSSNGISMEDYTEIRLQWSAAFP
jgi:hypothetical protein